MESASEKGLRRKGPVELQKQNPLPASGLIVFSPVSIQCNFLKPVFRLQRGAMTRADQGSGFDRATVTRKLQRPCVCSATWQLPLPSFGREIHQWKVSLK